jgi:hypothetical protein
LIQVTDSGIISENRLFLLSAVPAGKRGSYNMRTFVRCVEPEHQQVAIGCKAITQRVLRYYRKDIGIFFNRFTD